MGVIGSEVKWILRNELIKTFTLAIKIQSNLVRLCIYSEWQSGDLNLGRATCYDMCDHLSRNITYHE